MMRLASSRLKAMMIVALVLPLMMRQCRPDRAAWMVILGERGLAASIVSLFGFNGRLDIMYTEKRW
ncbi:MAG: hypothetical protein IPK59_23180 [Rhodospirillaceae bacterium]|nr:hypothetical protein [Rhodospirillaceae bacterium]